MKNKPFRRQHLVILDADGTTIDAFGAINRTFARHGMNLGDLERFQKRRTRSRPGATFQTSVISRTSAA